MKKRRIYIAYSGGTIGMRRGRQGYRPAPGLLAEEMATMPVLRRPEMPYFEIREFDPLLDSSNMTPADWVHIGQDLIKRYEEFDGFIVLHGTDTMAYTASALSFMLENLAKPIILTGSQVPLVDVRSDARENLITSLLIAAEYRIPEVMLFAGDRLLRGNRATKVSAGRFRAFSSPNYPALGDAGVELQVHQNHLLTEPTEAISLTPISKPVVADIRLFPGLTADTLERYLEPPIQGVVLHTYGVGNAPNHPNFLEVLERACRRGVVIVNCTQCLEGSVDMSGYATGRALLSAGVISGHDMTPEASLTKLLYLLSKSDDPEYVRSRIETSLRGELGRDSRSGGRVRASL